MHFNKDHSHHQSRLPFSKPSQPRDSESTNENIHQLSIKPSRMLGSVPPSDLSTSALLRQNSELRQRLAEEASNHRRRIDSFRLAQENQAALVCRLQSKVQQYRQRCSDLEGRVHDTLKTPPPCQPKITTGPTTRQVMCSTSLTLGQSGLQCSSSLDSSPICSGECNDNGAEVCRKAEDEHNKCEQLMSQNTALRQQLEESNRTNEALTNDLQKLTNDWANLRDEIIFKDDEYKEEEQAFKDYYISEQNRLLRISREVATVKQTFQDSQAAVKSYVAKMGIEIMTANKDILGACNSVNFSLTQDNTKLDGQLKDSLREVDSLQAQLATCRVQYEAARHEVNERDLRITELNNQLRKLDDRCNQAESQAVLANRYNEEIERLNNSIREIAQAVVQDADTTDREADTELNSAMQHMHLSREPSSSVMGAAGSKSPRQNLSRASQAFAEGTISAVQAALHKYQLALHDLQVKYQDTSEHLKNTRSQCEKSEETNNILTAKIMQLTEKLDCSNSKISKLIRERDSLQKTLDDMRQQKQNAEKSRAEINTAFEILTNDYEKLQLNSGKLQKKIDSLEEDKKGVELEIQRILKDKSLMETNLRSEENRGSRLREETISLREELNKVSLSRDLLEQQHIELENLLNLIEKQKADLEYDMDKMLLEKCELQERLEKFSDNNASKLDELKSMQICLDEAQEECKKVRLHNNAQANEITDLKKQLSNAEKLRLELETDNLSFSEKLKCLHLENEKILQDLACVTRDRSEIHNQLTACGRKKEALNEELMRMRQRLEQTTENNNRLNRNFEEIVKETEEKQVQIEVQEKEIHRLQELIATLRSEKESLEALLFDANTTLETTEGKRNNLERDLQESLVREESLRNNVARLQKDLEQSQRKIQEVKTQSGNVARTLESEFNQKLSNLRENLKEAKEKHEDEVVQQRNVLEKRMQQALQALQTAKDDEIDKLQERLETLQAQMESLLQQHEESMIRAENEKQQALLIAHRDKQTLAEKLETTSRDLKSEQENQDRNNREFNAREEKLRNTIAHWKDEIASLRTKEEENKIKLEECIKNQEIKLTSLKEERNNLSRLSEELKTEIRLKEDKLDAIRNDMQESLRKCKEGESYLEGLRKELTECRRQLVDSNIERDKYASSNKELREHIKRVESSKREQFRTIEEAMQKISSLEENKNTLENEKSRLTTIVKESENILKKTTQELNSTKSSLQKIQVELAQKEEGGKEAQSKLSAEIELKDRALQELGQIKKQLADLEANLCATRQELGRARCNSNQEEHRFHNREQELLARIEEFRGREKRLEDQKHNLEVCLADATQQMQELKARLGGAEGRIRALDEQLACVELHKRNTEHKLCSIAHTLRRIAGVQLDGSVTFSHRLLSPSRRFSPVRSVGGPTCFPPEYDTRSTSQCPDAPVDIDPDLVRKGLRNLMHQVAQMEREKEEFKSQLTTAKKQLQNATEQQLRCDSKLAKLQQMLRHLQEEKTNIISEKNIKISALQDSETRFKIKSDECQKLREKLAQAELQLAAMVEERLQKEERLEKFRLHAAKLEADKRHFQEEMTKVESRSSKLELQRVAMEGDITRLQMALQEKDCNSRQLQERLENQNRSIAQLEDRCTSLKTTVDQLKERLQKTTITETELRSEVKSLKKDLSEQTFSQQANEDKLKLLQKSLQAAENEKRIVQERLESAQNTVIELRRSQQTQMDNMQRLQEQMTDLEVQKSGLESQLRIAKWTQETQEKNAVELHDKYPEEDVKQQLKSSLQEKSELRSKVQLLQEQLKQIESERKSNFLSATQHDRSYDAGSYDSNRLEEPHKKGTFSCGLDHSIIEQEARDLRLKVRRLETLLAEKESELARLKAAVHDSTRCSDGDADRYRSVHMQAEKLLDAREQSHRQQILRLENQISVLREQLAQEAKRRQQYILRSSKANREMQHLRNTLGDSLRHVSQQPLDTNLLESESRRLDTAVSMSLPPSSHRDFD